jgi:hypothetical protein
MSLTIPAEILGQACTVEALQGTTGAGQDSYGAPVTLACRFEASSRTVKDATGRSVTRYGPLFLAPDAVLATGDRVTVTGQSYTVAQAEPLQGLDGPTHIEAELVIA